MHKNLETEILGKLLNLDSREEQIDCLSELGNTEDFRDLKNREIICAISKIVLDGQKADIVNTFNYLGKYATELSDYVSGVVSSADIRFTVKDLKTASHKRKLILAVEDGLKAIKGANLLSEIEEAKDKITADICSLDYSRESNFLDYNSLDSELMKNLSNSKTNSIDGYSWGVKSLDMFTNGIQTSKMYVIGALKKSGKTRFCFHCFRELYSQGVSVGFISLEVPKYEVYRMLKASFMKIDDNSLRSGNLKYLSKEKQQKLNSIKFDEHRLMIECNNSLTINQILNRIRRMVKLGAKIIFLDFIQRISFDTRNSVPELEQISKSLADISRELDIAIICLSQLSNQAEFNNGGSIANLKGSGAIGENADVILIMDNLSRRKVENQNNIIDVQITQRYGESGNVKIHSDLATCTFSDLAKHSIDEKIYN